MAQAETYDDPMGQTRQQVMQALATVATVGEAAARWAAVGIQNRAARREREAGQQRAAEAAGREAEALTAKVRAERQKMAASLDGDWLLNRASFAEAAAVWRTASVYAATGDPVAGRAARLAEQRLHRIRPDLMDAYQRHRQAGAPVAEAMRAAARQVWETDACTRAAHPDARTHGATEQRAAIGPDGPRALPAGGHGIIDELDAAVRTEAAHLAEHIRPEVLDELQRRWRATGRLPAGESIQLLRDLAVEVREGAFIGGLDGHTVEAFQATADGIDQALTRATPVRAAGSEGTGVQPVTAPHSGASPASDDGTTPPPQPDAAAAGGEVETAPPWAQAFPRLRVAQVDPAVAAKQPAPAVPAARKQGRTR